MYQNSRIQPCLRLIRKRWFIFPWCSTSQELWFWFALCCVWLWFGNGLFYSYSSGVLSWWRHRMEIFPALLALCAEIHRWPVNSPHKGQWRGALMFSLICAWNGWINKREAGDWRRHRAHCDVTVMYWCWGNDGDFFIVGAKLEQYGEIWGNRSHRSFINCLHSQNKTRLGRVVGISMGYVTFNKHRAQWRQKQTSSTGAHAPKCCLSEVIGGHDKIPIEQIRAWTKWSPCVRRHIQLHFG